VSYLNRRGIEFAPKDIPLRDEVRALGAMVGDVIREQGGEPLFSLVEQARLASIRWREGESAAAAELHALVRGLPPRDAETLVRAFATYFEVVNLAERIHRIRRRRDYLRAETDPQEGSLEATVRRLSASGLGAAETRALLDRLRIEPVFTAHPTESMRRTLLEKEQVIGRLLVERLDPSRTPYEERAALGRIREEVTAGWQTDPHPSERPTVMDELEHVVFYLTDVIYRIVPPFYEELEDAVTKVYGDAAPIRPILRFGSWVGGDMDGNPNVGAESLRAALARHRSLVLERYRSEALELMRRLSQSGTRVGVSDAVRERVAEYSARFPDVLAGITARYHDMPYRVLFALVAARLEATRRDAADGYAQADELADDLGTVITSLKEYRGEHAGMFAVRRFLRRVETFGFHLATLDVRQDAHVHRAVLSQLLDDPGWAGRAAAERADRLRRALLQDDPPAVAPDAAAARTLAVFQAIADCRARYGPAAIGPYIISMARGADDVLGVLLLARWGGLATHGPVPLDVAPLFETVADLDAAPGVVTALLADDYYRDHLRRRGNHQIVMLGYSDSNKDAGIAASRWALQHTQRALVDAVAPSHTDLTIFHGRGGTISRGGGRITAAILAAPPGSVRGRLRVTEQGEAINAKYGLRGIAMRTLEQAVGAVALATALPPPADPREPGWIAIMDEIARDSRDTYRGLVYGDDRFAGYFRLATPIDVIERMEIGSRPASRPGTGRPGGDIERLRAIPWVFAWTQSRHLLPGWFGLGSALARAFERHGDAVLTEMGRDWAFLRALADDVEIVLGTADLEIAARYACLAGELGEQYFPIIRAEYDRTVAHLLALRGQTTVLASDPAVQRSILLRNPYVDPMSLLQIDLLERWRASGRADEELFRPLLATVRGIAQGLQSTG
jgi:phosphoenolpyruvate carboxylase